MSSLCLCMIVRDEVENLPRCLSSCRAHISHWVICDTGSTDGTQDLIRRELADIPGELHEHPWVDFGHNRTRLMELARDKADYLLLLDADWTFHAREGALEDLTADSYLVRHGGPVEFHNKRIVSGRLPWRYLGATHEFITSEQERTCGRLEDVVIQVHSVGGERTARWRRDAEMLRAEVDGDPANARATFYLAQTYRDMAHSGGDRELLLRARHWYARRTCLSGWEEETYSAWHHFGSLSAELGDWPAAMEALVTAWELRPQRLEAVHELAIGLRTRERHRTAHRFTSLAAGLDPLPIPDDSLFVAPWIYRWGLLFEYSISSYWVGEYGRAIAACDRLLGRDDLPAAHRAQTERNRTAAINRLAATLAARTVAHAPGGMSATATGATVAGGAAGDPGRGGAASAPDPSGSLDPSPACGAARQLAVQDAEHRRDLPT